MMLPRKGTSIPLGVSAHADVAQESHHIAMHRAVDLDGTQKADGIVRLFALVDDDVIAKFDPVAPVSPGRDRRRPG